MIYINSQSAVEYWFNGTRRNFPEQPFNRVDIKKEYADSDFLDRVNLPEPVNLMIGSANNRTPNDRIRYSVKPAHLPAKSFIKVTDGVCVACPELCFLQAANYLDLAYLVEFGNYLCGCYVYDGHDMYLQRSREPITNVKRIEKFLDSAANVRGVKPARRALKYVRDGSGSPMESRILAFFFIRVADGGLGLKPGTANGKVKLSENASRLVNTKYLRVDILWESDKFAFEYDSTMGHENEMQRRYDCNRQSALNQSGYSVMRATRDNFSSFQRIENMADSIRKGIGTEKKDGRLEKYRDKRYKLMCHLFREEHSFFALEG